MRRLLFASLALGAIAAAGLGALAVAQSSATAEAAAPAVPAGVIGPVAADLVPLPPQPAGVPWPTAAWPTGTLPPDAAARIDAILDTAFDQPNPDLGETRALLVVQGGRLVVERYGTGFDENSLLISWSMAKSVTAALAGIAVGEGRLSLDAPLALPAWDEGDPRRAITLRQALQMSDGLRWNEIDYADAVRNDAAQMLFGRGRENIVAYAASKPLAHPPGTHWTYSSGTTNLVAAAVSRSLGPRRLGDSTGREAFRNFMFGELFRPIGMNRTAPEFDRAGNLYGSSLIHASARDWARFGYLHLRDGMWDGQRILPEGWVDFVRTPAPASQERTYGSHWWLSPSNGQGLLPRGPFDAFSANGHQGQYVIVIPSRDLVIVRLGITGPDGGGEAMGAWLQEIVDALPAPAGPAAPAGTPRGTP